MLSQEIWHDIIAHFWSYFLVMTLVVTAFAVVYFTHVNRQTTSELEVLLAEREELDIEWRNLLLEQNSLAETSEIEDKATRLLNMKRPDSKSEVIVELQ